MSCSLALMHFEDGTVLHGVYYGTSDVLQPWFTDIDDFNNNYDSLKDYMCQTVSRDRPNTSELSDIEEVEIYIDYGGGWMWKGSASKSKGYVVSDCNYDDNEPIRRISPWVYEYLLPYR